MTAVRPATSADAEPVARLLTLLGYPTSADEVAGRLDRLAGSRGTALVAEQERRIVGLATSHRLAMLNRANDVTWITALIVDESARGRGVGRMLIETIERDARSTGCERISVTTYDHLAGAHDFYLRVGFAQTGRRFGKDLNSAGVP